METRVYSGNLRKMRTKFDDPIEYSLDLDGEEIQISDYVGSPVTLRYTGLINCINCGRRTNKSFAQGFCFPCFQNAPENAECIIRPELCEAHLGKGRDPEWEERNHNQSHVVYLAVSAALKVGVTRSTQVPYRWIDQGASRAIILAETENRYQAGMIEVALKAHASDKTPWQKMLKNEVNTEIDLVEEKQKMANELDDEWKSLVSDNNDIINLNFPVDEFPEKVKSHNLDKIPELSGTLMGIKGQYLLFDENRVINIRKYGGYFVELELEA